MSPRRLLALLALVGIAFLCARSCPREQGREVAEPERERGSGELSAQEPSREPIVTEVAAPEPATSLAVLAVMLESWPEADALTGAQVELVRGAMRELARPVHMSVESTPMFEGEFGTHNGFNALKVTQVNFPQVAPSNDSHEFQAATP